MDFFAGLAMLIVDEGKKLGSATHVTVKFSHASHAPHAHNNLAKPCLDTNTLTDLQRIGTKQVGTMVMEDKTNTIKVVEDELNCILENWLVADSSMRETSKQLECNYGKRAFIQHDATNNQSIDDEKTSSSDQEAVTNTDAYKSLEDEANTTKSKTANYRTQKDGRY